MERKDVREDGRERERERGEPKHRMKSHEVNNKFSLSIFADRPFLLRCHNRDSIIPRYYSLDNFGKGKGTS
jgi:hypothetical protein